MFRLFVLDRYGFPPVFSLLALLFGMHRLFLQHSLLE